MVPTVAQRNCSYWGCHGARSLAISRCCARPLVGVTAAAAVLPYPDLHGLLPQRPARPDIVTAPDTRPHHTSEPPEADSSPKAARTAAAPRSHASTRRREAILDAALIVAAEGGYEAVHMRAVAERAGIAVGTLYRYFPSKTHLLASALTREFQRLDASYDWTTGTGTPLQRLDRLTAFLHQRWQRDPLLTEAMTRAFVVANTSEAAAVNQAAAVIERLLARTLSGGKPAPSDQRVAEVIADIWLANLTAFIGQRASAADTRERIERATRRVLHSLTSSTADR